MPRSSGAGDAIIRDIYRFMGRLAADEFFLENGAWRTDMTRCHEPKSRSLLVRIQGNGRKDDARFSVVDEAISLEKILRAMLIYEPTERATASDIMESDWMKRWGLPSLDTFS